MATDPSILLDAKPPQIDSAAQVQSQVADVATKYQNLKNLAAAEQVQQQQAQSLSLENQQRQIDMQNQQAINQAVSQNVKVDPQTGKAYIDHQGVVGTLTSAGKGVAAMSYQKQANAVQQSVLDLQQTQDKINNDRIQHVGSFAAAVENAPPGARPTVYAQTLPMLITNGYAKPGELPEQYDPSMDSQLAVLRDRALTAEQQYQAKWGQARVEAEQARSAASEERALASDERARTAQDKADQDNWKPNGTRNGNAVYYNPKTGEEKIGGPIDLQTASSGRGAGPSSGVTPTQRDRDFQKNSQTAASAEKDENAADTLRTQLSNAIQSGDYYVDAKGNPITWQKLIPQQKNEDAEDWAARIEKIKPQYVQDMKNRIDTATKAANEATARKNNAILANDPDAANRPGWVSTPQAIAARSGGAAQAPASTPGRQPQTQQKQPQQSQAAAKPTYLRTAVDGKGNRVGFNAATHQWEPIKQ